MTRRAGRGRQTRFGPVPATSLLALILQEEDARQGCVKKKSRKVSGPTCSYDQTSKWWSPAVSGHGLDSW